jgi:hypothetical protein
VNSVKHIGDHVQRMKRKAVQRDKEMLELQIVRQGRPELLFPELFNDTWRKSIVSNWIDAVSREFAEMIAPLPALNCSSRAMKTEADKRKAATKNLIGGHIWGESKLAAQMISAADAYLSYGFQPFLVEPDYKRQMPKIRAEDPRGFYYDNDRNGNTLRVAKCHRDTVDQLAAKFPEYAHLIKTKLDQWGTRQECAGDETVEVIQYVDKDRWVLFLPERSDLVLTEFENPIDACPYAIAERPGLFFGENNGGQFRDVIWVQLARGRMALLGLEAGVKAVGAPLSVGRDVVELPVGPDAVIVSDNPDKVRRVPIEVPNSTFALQETLENELKMGARYPEGRAGGIDASVITGRGIQALMGSFDTQISTAQTVIGAALAKVTEFAFEMDCKVWGKVKKRITGIASGEAYDFEYTPHKAIGDNYSCDVTYGFAAGLAPNAAVVMMLQLRGDGLVDRDTVRRNLPWSIDVDRMQRNLDVEQTADALKQGLFGLLAGLGPMAGQGMDPRPYLRTAAEIIKGRQNGKDLADLFLKAFDPEVMAGDEVPAGVAPGEAAPQDPMAALGGPQGAPGQAQMGPGGLPDIQTLVAGLRGGQPQLDAAVSRRIPAA